ncbi:MAG: NPCBM/NEW2 domain-containing protein [Candidatus Eremiobacterota bacterium]
MIWRFSRVALLLVLALTLAQKTPAETQAVPLVTFPREGFENTVWLYDRVKMGNEFVQGTLQGLGGATDSVIIYKLDKKYEVFEAVVGYIETAPDGKSSVFEVWADGVQLYATESIRSEEQPDLIRVPIKGAQFMQLRIRPDRYDGTHGAAWGQPMLYSGVGPDFVGTLLINRDGKKDRVVASKRKSMKEIDVMVPLKPGAHEYTIKVNYDQKAGTVDIQTLPREGVVQPVEVVPPLNPEPEK